MTMHQEYYDVTIIGGGPAGLYSAFYSGLREMKTKIIEYQPQLGGKVQIYPEKMVWDVGGLPPTTGAQLMDNLVQQALTFDPTIVLNEKVTSITRMEDGSFRIDTASGEKHYSKTVIVAVGSGILKPMKLPIEGADRYELTNLHYTVTSLQHFKDKTVVISGGGNSAIDWANALDSIAKKVYLSYRKEELKGHEAQVTQLLDGPTECLFHTSITNLIANKQQDIISEVELTNHLDNTISHIKVDDVIINHGFDRDASLLDNSTVPITLKDDYFIQGNALSESTVEGLYGAGDILYHEGKLNLIAGAFQDAANAVNRAKRFIQPDAAANGMVSSHNDMFKERNKQLIQELVQ
ncbi:NAD(P)/FAD-dependent oxidoreductase [Pontibacillus salicampi]|uniref:Ferredoxin--NADP reductase n=1 Tax=Pontibacillus salicampi TaxID=1449801 RepID=A0ABV6LKN6_9BACI